jgi:hypothetical protein
VSPEAELLARHLPVLRYDSQGSFLADSPAVMTDRPGNRLNDADGRSRAGADGRPPLRLAFLGWPKYGDGATAARSDYLDAVGRDYVMQARLMHREEYADRIHGRAVRADDGGWWLQYWLFYLYNDKSFLGFGLHEGDWEMVQVRLGPDEAPQAMAFAQHGHGQRCDWGMVERRGMRPIVYVARGSQASFASRGRHDAPVVPDYADGKGAEVADATLVVIGDRAPAWVAWQGRWGSSRARSKLESDSPRGPAHQDKWRHPATFHAECDEIRRVRAPAVPAPPVPEIAVRREGERAVVAYRTSTASDRPRTVALVVSVDDPADALPPATEGHAIARAEGELQHSLPLEEGPYEVRVSAADAAGNMSPPAEATLP